MLLSFSEGFAPLRAWRRRDDGGFCRVCCGMACSFLNATCFSERNVGVKPQHAFKTKYFFFCLLWKIYVKKILCSFVLFLAKKKEQTNQKRKKYAVKSDTKRSNFASGNVERLNNLTLVQTQSVAKSGFQGFTEMNGFVCIHHAGFTFRPGGNPNLHLKNSYIFWKV